MAWSIVNNMSSSSPKSRQREKLLNALVYISQNTERRSKTKYFKLLYYLDFLHYQRIGRSVTGLEYYAYEQGPVPEMLLWEWEKPNADFLNHLVKEQIPYSNGKVAHALQARKKFDSSVFSRFELQLLSDLCSKHSRDTAEEMSDYSHFQTGPWDEVWNTRQQKRGYMSYDLALDRKDDESDQAARAIASERKEFFDN